MELYPFQAEDVAKLGRQKSALIGSEMGTGKTHEAIALDLKWWNQTMQELSAINPKIKPYVPPTLVIAPLNTFDSWVEKYKAQAPDTDVYVIDRKDRGAFTKAIQHHRADVYLMHWDALRLMPELANFQFNVVIADEVHRAANRKAQVTRALKRLKTNHKLGLSGTASGDRPENLWSILNWLWPTYYKSYWRFVKYYCVYEMQEAGYQKLIGVKNTHILKKEMAPWYVRHLKRDRCCEQHPNGVMEWLPEKTYDTIWVPLSPTQRRLYNQMKDQMVSWVGEHENTPLAATAVVAQMVRLSQMALATPRLEQRAVRQKKLLRDLHQGDNVISRNEELGFAWISVMKTFVELELPSTKIEAMRSLILDHPEKSFVVFTSSKKAAYLAEQDLKEHKVSVGVLSGDTPTRQRDLLKMRFRNKDVRVFIGVIAASSEGVDGLQEATDTMIFLDRDWSAIRNKQAEDRLHRGGQKDTVQIIDIMARDTVDLGRHQKLVAKWEWIRKILGDDFNNSTYQGDTDPGIELIMDGVPA